MPLQRMSSRDFKRLHFTCQKLDSTTGRMVDYTGKQIVEHTQVFGSLRTHKVFDNGYLFSDDFHVPWRVGVNYESIDALCGMRGECRRVLVREVFSDFVQPVTHDLIAREIGQMRQ